MRDILDDIMRVWRTGQSVGLATVISTFRSAPRLPGSAMLTTMQGQAIGSVSGGCIDGAVYDYCIDAMETRRSGVAEFGVSDDSAFAVGLTCGGTIEVFVEAISRHTFPAFTGLYDDVCAGAPVAVATTINHPDAHAVGRKLVVRGDSTEGGLGSDQLDLAVARDSRALLASGRNSALEFGVDGSCDANDVRIFVSVFAPAPRMVVFGANAFASALIDQARLQGYSVTLCDARPLFATTERYPTADEVVVDWPHRYLDGEIRAGRIDGRTALCVLTHDPKFDIPLLRRALRDCPAGYIGAMGSRRTHEQRIVSLTETGLTDDEMSRLASPIGLDLGASTPEETAVSIMAELIQLMRGGSGRRLALTRNRIHPAQPVRL
ncbi:XdhC family protein [Rhodococcus sp. NPDC057014]|uniref:XdhC family protein n=1 Tax=Rhodococcus sp. NPDC057014 TaxID=3346000 RepID=UPI0036405B1F